MLLLVLTAVFLVIHWADLSLTLRGVAIGKRERNPVARLLMRRMGQVQGLVFLKLASVGCFLLLAAQLDHSWRAGVLTAASLLGVAVVANNVGVLRRARKRGRQGPP